MNEQIKKLKQAAGIDYNPDQEGLDLFARLIVEECAKICSELKFTTEGPSEGAAYQRTLCEMSIKENFGLVSKGPITAKNVK
jgi:predicted HAD superfamily phosphohydrolase